MKVISFLQRIGTYAAGDIARRVLFFESSVAAAFESLQKRWPAITGTELTVAFTAGSADSANIAHGLGEIPNRFVVTYTQRAQAYKFLAADVNVVSFTRSSTTGDSTARIVVYRAPAEGDVPL